MNKHVSSLFFFGALMFIFLSFATISFPGGEPNLWERYPASSDRVAFVLGLAYAMAATVIVLNYIDPMLRRYFARQWRTPELKYSISAADPIFPFNWVEKESGRSLGFWRGQVLPSVIFFAYIVFLAVPFLLLVFTYFVAAK